MDKDLILVELVAIQSNYLELLKHLVQNCTDITSRIIVDNILIFWKSNEKFVKYAFSDYFEVETTNVFTAATKINTLKKGASPIHVA